MIHKVSGVLIMDTISISTILGQNVAFGKVVFVSNEELRPVEPLFIGNTIDILSC